MFKRIITIALIVIMMFVSGCTKVNTEKKITAQKQESELKDVMGDFAFELIKNCDNEGGNIMISPVSAALALAMTTNGAVDNTLIEMEKILGKELNADLINEMYSWYSALLQSDEEVKLAIANSIWIKNAPQLQVKDDFLNKCLTYYDAEVYVADFDGKTITDINAWVSEKTDGMVDEIIKEFKGKEVMLLLNAIVFDAEWESIYYENMVHETDFTSATGNVSTVEGMYSEENIFISDENTTGFIKDYKGGFRFVALLPDEDISIDEYVQSFTGEKYWNLMESKTNVHVNAMIPKFSYEYNKSLKEPLKNMGMEQAFDMYEANFTDMAVMPPYNIYIGDVIHKTYIEVGEKGTKAAAVTMVEMLGNDAIMIPEEIEEVYLDRPFMYMIIDEATNVPIFVGVVRDI